MTGLTSVFAGVCVGLNKSDAADNTDGSMTSVGLTSLVTSVG